MMTSVTGRIPGEQMVGPSLYELDKVKYGSRQLEKQYEDILGPLSLFAPLPSEEVPDSEDIEEERPVTPIEESIKAPPSTFKQLAKLIRRRVAAKPGIEHLTQDEQKTLAGVIMGEVNCIWPDIRRQVDDPFLTPEENKELQRRITVHIVTVCEQIFHHYVEKAKVLSSRGVFSEQANISRLKAQLSLDANKFLNILAIRRYIVADIQGKLLDLRDEDQITGQLGPEETFVPLSYKKLIECSRPKRRHGYNKTVEQEIKDMDQQMPLLQPKKALEFMPDAELMQKAIGEMEERAHDHPEIKETSTEDEILYEATEEESVADEKSSVQMCSEVGRRNRLPRPDSLPELHHDFLLEELGLEKPSKSDRPSSSTQRRKKLEDTEDEVSVTVQPSDKVVPLQQVIPPSPLKSDLQQLSVYTSMKEKARDEPMKEEEDLPPLLQAVDECERGQTRRTMLQKRMKEMEAEKMKKEEEERYRVTEPTHPQPSVVTTKLRDKSVVRTSDIRVSERVQQGRVSLQLYKTVFNELTDEVDANTIKRMDSNLFRGQEINEVYNEIMKTLPTDHHDFDGDDFVELCADPKALQKTPLLAAANLTAVKQGRVINSELCAINQPPWGEDRDTWCHSPIFNATFAQQNPAKPVNASAGNTLLGDFSMPAGGNNYTLGGPGQGLSGHLGDNGVGLGHGMNQALMDERNARSYASWLAWWKNTISSEDYIKYLSTQESDYLGVVFHFYDHEGGSSVDDKSETDEERLAQMAKEKERLQKLTELREQKSQYTEGMWNVATVTLGGLGKDPDIEDELEETSRIAANSPSTQNLVRTHSGKVRVVRSVASTPVERATALRVPGDGSTLSRSPSRADPSRGRIDTASPSHGSPEAILPTSQDRLEAIWSSLQMPDHLKLDMAIKYSSNEYSDKLNEAIETWEVAVNLILQREDIVSKLELFERFASDPDRFFQKGQRGLSVARLQEAKKRSNLYTALHNLEGPTRRKIQLLEKKFQDKVTYQGRPYLDKMKVDCTEMLYWLQQERRQQALQHAAATVSSSRDIPQTKELPVAELPEVSLLSTSVR